MTNLEKQEQSSPALSEYESYVVDLSVDNGEGKIGVFFARIWYTLGQWNSARADFASQHPLVGYSIKRIVYAIITLFLSISVLFLIVRVITPDATYLSGTDITKLGIKPNTPEYDTFVTNRMKLFGVYGSIWEQLGRYLYDIIPFLPKHVILQPNVSASGVITGESVTRWINLGVVFSTGVSEPGAQVTSVFAKAIPYSFAFGAVGVGLSYTLGIPLGIWAARKKGKGTDSTINGVSIFVSSIPPLIIVIAIYYLSIYSFGSAGIYASGTFGTKLGPVIVIVLMQTPAIVINTRRYVIDEMTADYTKFALAKGLTEEKVFFVHIWRNAGIRIIRTIPVAIVGTLFGSSIFTEMYWSIPGMSRFIVSSINNRDVFVIMGYVVFSATIGVITSLIADLLMSILDPRVKLTK